jgi:hypothetical protein
MHVRPVRAQAAEMQKRQPRRRRRRSALLFSIICPKQLVTIATNTCHQYQITVFPCRYRFFARDLDKRLANQPPQVRQEMLAQSEHLAEAKPPKGANEQVVHDAVKHAFVRALRMNTLASAALAALLVLGVLVITPKKRTAT